MFLQINRLTKTIETILNRRSKEQEVGALNKSNSNVSLEKLLNRRSTSWSSTTQVQYIIQNDVYANNSQAIAESFDELFASSLVNDNNASTTESYSTGVFLPNGVALLLIETKLAATLDLIHCLRLPSH